MLRGHKEVAKLLKENEVSVRLGDVGYFACTDVEQNNLNLLKEIVRFGGEVTQPRGNGTTSLHVAVYEENIDIFKFLLEHGADVDKKDVHGWSPRDLVDQQGHEEIKLIFQAHDGLKSQFVTAISEKQQQHGVRYLGRFTSDPAIRPIPQEGSFPNADGSWGQSQPKRRTNIFHNSLFGIMSAMHSGEKDLLYPVRHSTGVINNEVSPMRVTISYLKTGEIFGKLVLLPKKFQELLEIGSKKFKFWSIKVLMSKNKAEIEVIRDSDHLIFSNAKTEETM